MMTSFKLWFLSAVLFAIVFPRSTVFADDVPEPPAASFTDETVRTWKDTSGEFTTQAVLVGVQKDIVSLRKKDDRTIQVPLSKLSKADRAYVQSKLKKALSTAEKRIVGSWKVTLAVDPKKFKAEFAKDELVLKNCSYIARFEFRTDGTFTSQGTDTKADEGTWKLMDKGEKRFVLDVTFEAEEKLAFSCTWISKDEFALEPPDERADTSGLITGAHFRRKKEAIVFPRSTVVGSWTRAPTFHYVIDLLDPAERDRLKKYVVVAVTASVEFRADGTLTFKDTDTQSQAVESTWKFMDKGEKRLVLEMAREALSLTWIDEDQFALELPDPTEGHHGLTGYRFLRNKDAPKP